MFLSATDTMSGSMHSRQKEDLLLTGTGTFLSAAILTTSPKMTSTSIG